MDKKVHNLQSSVWLCFSNLRSPVNLFSLRRTALGCFDVKACWRDNFTFTRTALSFWVKAPATDSRCFTIHWSFEIAKCLFTDGDPKWHMYQNPRKTWVHQHNDSSYISKTATTCICSYATGHLRQMYSKAGLSRKQDCAGCSSRNRTFLQ